MSDRRKLEKREREDRRLSLKGRGGEGRSDRGGTLLSLDLLRSLYSAYYAYSLLYIHTEGGGGVL